MADAALKSWCSHPARNGRHEVYRRPDGSSVCRACGEEFAPPATIASYIEIPEGEDVAEAFAKLITQTRKAT